MRTGGIVRSMGLDVSLENNRSGSSYRSCFHTSPKLTTVPFSEMHEAFYREVVFLEPRLAQPTCNIKYSQGESRRRVRAVPLVTLSSVVGDVQESEEGGEEDEDVEDPGHHGDEVVGDHQDDALEGLEAAVEGDDEDDVADADAEQGDEGRGPEEVGVLVDEDPRRQGEARVQLGAGLAGEYRDEQDDQLREVLEHGVVAPDLPAQGRHGGQLFPEAESTTELQHGTEHLQYLVQGSVERHFPGCVKMM